MKKIAIILSLAAIFIFASTSESKSQCKQQRVYKCATLGGNAIYLRDFNTKLKRVKTGQEATSGTKWTVVLNKGTRYKFILCTPDGFEEKVVLTLYDSQHPERTKPWAKTTSDRYMFDYICRRSGMYYVSIRFKKGQAQRKTCAVGILSFVGKNQ